MGYLAICLFGGNIVTHFLLKAENKKKKAGKRDYLIEGKSEEEIREIGDRNPSFLYVT